MLPDPQDTIVALATSPGSAARAILRVSGPEAWRVTGSVFTSTEPGPPRPNRIRPGELRLSGVAAPLPADLYAWHAPHSYTGQDMTELHILSCPPLLDLAVAQLLQGGGRAAQHGEFTLRAFLAGKLDLTRAEAVLGVIEAGSREELRQALVQLAGGMAQPLRLLREDLLDLLADVEAGLDFSDENIQFVGKDELLHRLARGLAQITNLQRQLRQRAVADRPFRAVLAGRPNAGKSSLFNALAGTGAALVSPEPGTTRDYLVRRLELAGVAAELVDTAGWRAADGAIEAQAQALGQEQSHQADVLLLCLEAGRPLSEEDRRWLARTEAPTVVGVATKCDLAPPAAELLATSAVTGAGLEPLRQLLAEKARRRALPALAPSLSRCQHHVQACLEDLRRAHAVVLFGDPAEILALELRGALEQLGEMVGAVYTDDLLDRIFSRFCIGK